MTPCSLSLIDLTKDESSCVGCHGRGLTLAERLSLMILISRTTNLDWTGLRRHNHSIHSPGASSVMPPAPAPDTLPPTLKLDDTPLHDILKHLYRPDSRHELSPPPAETLGHVYEPFRPNFIRLTPGRQAKIEDKPARKKARGVYYTPTY